MFWASASSKRLQPAEGRAPIAQEQELQTTTEIDHVSHIEHEQRNTQFNNSIVFRRSLDNLRQRNPGYATAVLKRLAHIPSNVAVAENVRDVLDFMVSQTVAAWIVTDMTWSPHWSSDIFHCKTTMGYRV